MKDLPKHLPADERKTFTIETVIKLAGEKNPSDITTAAIADQMNLSPGALFRHFPTKEALWGSVMEWVAEKLLKRIDRSVVGLDSPLRALEAMFISHIEFVSEHPGVPRMMFGELQHIEQSVPKRMAQTILAAYRERLLQRLRAGIANGELREDLDIHAATVLYIGMIQGLVMQSLLTGDLTQMRDDALRIFALYRQSIVRVETPSP